MTLSSFKIPIMRVRKLKKGVITGLLQRWKKGEYVFVELSPVFVSSPGLKDSLIVVLALKRKRRVATCGRGRQNLYQIRSPHWSI
jgi:hypothetical protein